MLRSTDGMFYSKVTLFLCHSNQHPRGSSSTTVEHLSNTLALKGIYLENQGIATQFQYASSQKYCEAQRDDFGARERFLRTFNFSPTILEVVIPTKVTEPF